MHMTIKLKHVKKSNKTAKDYLASASYFQPAHRVSIMAAISIIKNFLYYNIMNVWSISVLLKLSLDNVNELSRCCKSSNSMSLKVV